MQYTSNINVKELLQQHNEDFVYLQKQLELLTGVDCKELPQKLADLQALFMEKTKQCEQLVGKLSLLEDWNEIKISEKQNKQGIKDCNSKISKLNYDKAGKKEVDIINSRLDTFTKLQEGSTTADAELTDIRNMTNGRSATTAGEAVRQQYTTLDNKIKILNDGISYIKRLINKNTMQIIGKTYPSIWGNFTKIESLDCYKINVIEGEKYYYSGYYVWEITPYAIEDSQGNIIEIGCEKQSHGVTKKFSDYITIPAKASKLVICSAKKKNDNECENGEFLLEKLIPTPISENIMNYKYDGIGEYKNVVYPVSNGFINLRGQFYNNESSKSTDYIYINDFTKLYITAKAQYETRIITIYDDCKNLIGSMGYNASDNVQVTLWNKKEISSEEILKEYPQAKFIRICSYEY